MANPAVVLLSGGADSATCVAFAKRSGYSIYALTLDYGQRHREELDKASRLAESFGVAEHKILKVDLASIASSSLTGHGEVEQGRNAAEMSSNIPSTYVPARNIVFLSLALSWAESVGGSDIFIGVNALDYSGYPDCRPEFIESFEKMARLGTKGGTEGAEITIHTPLLRLSKAEIFKLGTDLGVDFGMTHSCYSPVNGRPCGLCDSCQLRRRGFEEAGLTDPLDLTP